MWKFKGCPRCGGDILIYLYHDVKHESCLQCGYHSELYIKAMGLLQLEIGEESSTSV